MLSWFKRKRNPARELALMGVEKRREDRRAKVRATVDAMRRELNLPAIDWEHL